MSGVIMVVKPKHILDKFSFTHKIVGFVKDERPNLQTYVQALKVVVSCGHLDTTEPFDGHCFGHTLSKVCHMPFPMTRWLACYNMHQSNLPKLTSKNISHG